MDIQTAVVLIVLAAFELGVFRGSRKLARSGFVTRGVLLVAAGGLLAAGVLFTWWLPPQVPDTPGSAASLVGILVLWGAGGLFVLLGTPMLLGTLFPGRRRA